MGVLGNDRLRVLPIWELTFGSMAQGAWPIATEKVKHDPDYQERRGIQHGPAKDLSPEVRARIQRSAKRIFRTLELDGYARIDFRLSAEGIPYFLEANPLAGLNPWHSDLPILAAQNGIEFAALIGMILDAGLARYGLSRGGGERERKRA